MEVIKPPTSEFDFKRITLANPVPLQNGSYFTKISLEDNKLLVLQLGKCSTKQGLIDNKGVKYCDLMYERSVNEDLMNWLEKLEYASQDKLNEKKELWFQSDLSRDDIESMMAPIMRIYQSGKYILIRTSLNSQKTNGMEKSIAYNEQETCIDIEKLDRIDSIIPLVIINGIKFSSRSFEIDIILLQMMVFNKPITSPCLIKCINTVQERKHLEVTESNKVSEHKITLEKPLQSIQSVQEKPLQSIQSVQEKPLQSIQSVQEKVLVQEKALQSIQSVQEKSLQSIQSVQEKPLDPSLEEVSIDYKNISDSISLKNPNEVYYEIYKAARIKAKQLRKVAMEAYLEAKEIKSKYMLTDFDDDSSESEESEDEDT